MAIPYTFANRTGSIALAELDANFATSITLGTTPVQLGYTTITLNGVTLTNPTIGSPSSGGVAYGLGGLLQYTAAGTSTYVLTAQGPGVAPIWAPVTSTSGGTVTSVAVTSANGFAGTVAFPTAAANITMTTTVTGLIKGNGVALSPAAVGADYSEGTAALATGIVKSTTSTGALSIAVENTDYLPATSPAVISVSSASGALRITQTGAGNALVVEDSANPDATPFVVDTSGNVGIGTLTPSANLHGQANTSFGVVNYTAGGATSYLFRRSSGVMTAPTIVASGDSIAGIAFQGYDGAAYISAAQITGVVDGTPGTNDMPGRLVFSTTTDGAAAPTERMRIDSAGNVGVGTASFGGFRFSINSDSVSSFKNHRFSTDASSAYHYTDGNFYAGATGANAIVLITNNTERFRIDSAGNVTPGVTNTQTLGAVGDVWSNVYATTFTGALTGNADTVTNGVYTNATNTFTGTNAFNGTTIHTFGNVVSTYTGYFQLGGRGIRKTTTGSNIEIINNANTVITHTLYDNGDFTAVGNVTAYSDLRLKKDLVQIPDALAKVRQLTGYTYTRIDTGEKQTGVVAQDVQKVLPEAVVEGEHLSVAYGNMVGLLIEAIKELEAQVTELRTYK